MHTIQGRFTAGGHKEGIAKVLALGVFTGKGTIMTGGTVFTNYDLKKKSRSTSLRTSVMARFLRCGRV